MNTIAATTTRTGLRVRAELDTGAYDTGARVSDRQMEALPLARHDWHGNWNYTLHPQEYDQAAGVPDPFDQPSPDLARLCHPALTSLPARDWNALTAALMKLHDQQREISLHKRRGYRPRLTVPAPAAGLPSPTDSWPPCCTSASPCPSRRRSLVQRPARKRSTSASATSGQLLEQAGYTIQPSPRQLASLDDLYGLATTAGIVIRQRPRRRVNDLQALNSPALRLASEHVSLAGSADPGLPDDGQDSGEYRTGGIAR